MPLLLWWRLAQLAQRGRCQGPIRRAQRRGASL